MGEENKEFKLLAIRPLKGCDPRFLKNLQEGAIYKFYQDYKFLDAHKNGIEIKKSNNNIESDVAKVEFPQEILDLYSPKDSDLKINISAVVGKNGSGKSTLIELLFVAVYILAVDQEILDHIIPKQGKQNKKKDIYNAQSKTKKRIGEIKKEINEDCIESIASESFSKLKKRVSQLNWNEGHLKYLEGLEVEIPKIKKELKVAIFYQIDENIIRLTFNSEGNSEFTLINDDNKSIDEAELEKNFIGHFFYSLILNYSQYALNSNEIGVWIQELFHKNDAYQTPIVINPMRTDGNYDINKENKLARQRLLANILEPLHGRLPKDSMRQLAKGHVAKRIKLTLNTEKFRDDNGEVNVLENTTHPNQWEKIKDYFSLESGERTKTKFDEYARQYIINKLFSMSEKYSPYQDFSNLELDMLKDYLELLEEDNSHIAYKFHQAVNFLKYDYAKDLIISERVENLGKEEQFIKIKSLSKTLSSYTKVDTKLIHLIPPPIFDSEVYFDDAGNENSLGRLSSGEKQYVYSISSIMYHLRYLDSVEINKVPHKYKYVNLIFDEVELYYHPELQRTFINDLLEAIKRCKLEDIKSINCIFITHSPFILSDIPSSNILKLKKGELIVNDQLTFGANIHDLLANDFFLKQGFMGSFAKGKINSTIKWLNAQKTLKDRGELDNKADSFINEKIKYKKIIELIGENILRVKLTEMLSQLNEDDVEFKEMIKNEIYRLNSLIQN